MIRVNGFTPREHAGLRIPPDRIAAATYLCCTACAGGDVDLLDAEPDHMAPVLETLEAMGCAVTARPGHVHIGVSGRLRAPGGCGYPAIPGVSHRRRPASHGGMPEGNGAGRVY